LSYTSYTELMELTLREFWEFRYALANVLEREREARAAAQGL